MFKTVRLLSKNLLLALAVLAFVVGPLAPAAHANTATTEFGFSVPFDDITPGGLADFKTQVDLLAANNQTWVRTGIASWNVGSWNNGQMSYDNAALQLYEDAFAYVKSKGLKMYITLFGQGHGSDFATFKTATTAYWQDMSARYGKYMDILQIFNEVNGTRDFNDNSVLVDSDRPAYYQRMREMLVVAQATFNTATSNPPITTNSAGWPVNATVEQQWLEYFDVVHDQLDIIALDLYPDNNMTNIEYMPVTIENARQRFNKPVIVAETGLPTATDMNYFPVSDQTTYLPIYMDTFKKINTDIVIVYQIRDAGTDRGDVEQNFGLLYRDNTPKASFAAVLGAMQPPAQPPTSGAPTAPVGSVTAAGTSAVPAAPNTGIRSASTVVTTLAVAGVALVLLGGVAIALRRLTRR